MAHVYLLRCSDDTFYVGSTTALDDRLAQHASGEGAAYTRTRLPVELMWSQEFDTIDEAWVIERKLHGWGRASGVRQSGVRLPVERVAAEAVTATA